MKAKVIVVLLVIILLLVAVYAAAFLLGAPRAEAPVSPEASGEEAPVIDSSFRGPTGLPHVEGPSTPPPGAP